MRRRRKGNFCESREGGGHFLNNNDPFSLPPPPDRGEWMVQPNSRRPFSYGLTHTTSQPPLLKEHGLGVTANSCFCFPYSAVQAGGRSPFPVRYYTTTTLPGNGRRRFWHNALPPPRLPQAPSCGGGGKLCWLGIGRVSQSCSFFPNAT